MINNSLQHSNFTRNRELNSRTLTTTELRSQKAGKILGLILRSIPISNQVIHLTFPSSFVVTSIQFTSTDETPFHHQWGSISFYNPIPSLKCRTIF